MSENGTFGFQPEIDQTRAVAVYIRQADQKADISPSGNRMMLPAQQDYEALLFGESEGNVCL